MGAHEQEETALLLTHGTANTQAAVDAAAVQEGPNTWRGSLLGCCSGCDSKSWGSCLLGYFLPCVAFGHNMRRALNLSAFTQAVVYLVLFLAGFDILVKDATPLPGSLDDRDVSFGAHHQHSQEHHHGSTPECHQALAALGATYSVMLLLLIIGVVYAARRRTQIREKFGITGSHWGDLCTWFWCGPCALCQETRTIMSNNVHNGVWYGQSPSQISASAYIVPEVEDMQADYKPVDAKDFV